MQTRKGAQDGTIGSGYPLGDAQMMVLAIGAYAVIAVIAGLMTLSEHAAKGTRNPLMKVLSLVACAVWPLVLLAMIVAMRRQMAAPRLQAQTA